MNIRYLSPYIIKEIASSKTQLKAGNAKKAFKHLENAHVLGQHSTYFHTKVHILMLLHGAKQSNWKEMLGQVLRIIGALTKTAIGLLPKGNTGGSNVSPFAPMKLSEEHQTLFANASRYSAKR